MINVKDFDSNLQKIVQKHWHLQQWINCNKKNENINSVNPLYLIIVKPDGYIEENIGSKYLVFTSTDGNKKELTKLTKLWRELNISLRQ